MSELIAILRKRAAKGQKAAGAYLAIIMFVISAGIIVFVFQQQLGLLDIQSGRGTAEVRVNQQLETNNNSLQGFQQHQVELLRKLGLPVQSLIQAFRGFRLLAPTFPIDPSRVSGCVVGADPNKPSFYPSIAGTIMGCINSGALVAPDIVASTNMGFAFSGLKIANWNLLAEQVEGIPDSPNLMAEVHDAASQEKALQNTRLQLTSKLDTLHRLDADDATQASAGVSAAANPTLKWMLIQTWITRFEILALVIFLTSILSALYRYTARLSHLYAAQADALELAASKNASIKDIQSLIRTFTPSIDFGKPPKTPTEEIVELARALSFRDQT